MPDSNPPIIIGPLLALLRSRKVLIAISAIITGILISKVPELAAIRTELMTLIIGATLTIIGGTALEDAAKAGRDKAAEPPEEVRELVRELFNEFLDGLVTPPTDSGQPVVPPSDHG